MEVKKGYVWGARDNLGHLGNYNNLIQEGSQRAQIDQEWNYVSLLQENAQDLLKCLEMVEEIKNG